MTAAFLSKNFTKYYEYVKKYYDEYVPSEAKKAYEDYKAIFAVILP